MQAHGAADQGTDPILYIHHERLRKQMEGHSMQVLLLLMALLAWNAETKHMKIGLTFGNDFLSAVFHICPDTFLIKDSQTGNRIPRFHTRQALTAQHQKCQFQLHRRILWAVQVSYHIKTVSGCSFLLFPVLLYFLPRLFSNRNIWLYKLLWNYFILSLILSFPVCSVHHHNNYWFQAIINFLTNVTVTP